MKAVLITRVFSCRKIADELLEGRRTEKSVKSFWERQFRLYKYVAKCDDVKLTHTGGGDGDEIEGKAEASDFTEAVCNDFRNSWKYEPGVLDGPMSRRL